jgi:TFIIF-interacting CTD phosphatase-like protein
MQPVRIHGKSETMKKPRSKLILVLDIDETLVNTNSNPNEFYSLNIYSNPNNMKLRDRIYTLDIVLNRGEGSSVLYWGVKRPHLEEFLQWANEYFLIIIPYSAGTYDYVHTVFPEISRGTFEPHHILTRLDCIKDGDNYTKPFWKLTEVIPDLKDYIEYDLSPTGEILGYKNVVIIDDRSVSFKNNPQNGILIPAYDPVYSLDGIKNYEDDALLKIMKFFNALPYDVDIRHVDKSHIFGGISRNEIN